MYVFSINSHACFSYPKAAVSYPPQVNVEEKLL